jgi:transcriptional regulator with XRE-family HTH domain
MSKNNPCIGQKIKLFREFRNLTQEYVAQELEMSVSGFSRLERNEVNISLRRLQQIAHILKVEAADLLSEGPVLLPAQTNGQVHSSVKEVGGLQVESRLEKVYQQQIDLLQQEIAYLRALLQEVCAKIPNP